MKNDLKKSDLKSYIRVSVYIKYDSNGNRHIDEPAMVREFNRRLEALTQEKI